ncbi:MAG: glycoside hydrolase family 97 catalytic domain-containing protein [Candidatus Cryptobacteroides sp.]|jgi:alpha-glucosidase
MNYHFLPVLILITVFHATTAESQELTSPDGRIGIQFTLCQEDPASKVTYPGDSPFYAVSYDGRPFLLPSHLGFDLSGVAELKHYLRIVDYKYSEHRNRWKPIYGEQKYYPDNYNEMRVMLQETLYPERRLDIVFRAYNEGIAFRYEVPDQPGFERVVLTSENTEFSFPKFSSVWESHGHEGKYYKLYPSEILPGCELPLTCVTPSGIYGAIMEAGCNHYPRAYLEAPYKKTDVLRIQLRGEAKSSNGITTCWRVITLSEKPGNLMINNYLLYNLSKECALEATDWIKPGTAMRETTISTPEAYRMIDFCESMGIDYMIFDWGWYGKAGSQAADPRRVQVADPITGIGKPDHPGLDLPAIIKYGEEHNVGIFLYVNREGCERYADEIFPLYEKWGIKGIKPGFVHVGNQEWQEWIENFVAKAAEHHLLVDIHDAYRPDGLSRTYPNLLTQEGIHGTEQEPNADHSAMLPYTRFTCGAGDFTPGFARTSLQTTFSHRLALAVIYYSPVQFLFWNEKLSAAHYRPELEFWKDLPTTWDKTEFLSGEVGESAVVARRKGDVWYVGGITNTNARQIGLDCSFLDPGRFIASIYMDKDDGTVEILKRPVTSKTHLDFDLLASGGFTIKIEPVKK